MVNHIPQIAYVERSQSLPAGWNARATGTPSHGNRLSALARNRIPIGQISEQDVVIAVMGPTGTGKSSFINLASNQNHAIVSDGLQSCTQEVLPVSYPHPDGSGRNIVLVDTPGFNDTNLTDSDVLERIAQWFTATYAQKITLTGLLFFHRISDNRFSGNPFRNLEMFQRLCGMAALENVILITTMWDETEEETGSAREQELRQTYWKSMISCGSRMARFGNTHESAREIVRLFINNVPLPVLLQREMVDDGKELVETAAGSTLFHWWDDLITKFREMLHKLDARLWGPSRDTDPEAEEDARKERLELAEKIEVARRQKRKLKLAKGLRHWLSGMLTHRKSKSGVPAPESGMDRNARTLAGIITALRHADSVANMARVPFLSGAIQLMLTMTQAVQSMQFVERALLGLMENAGSLILLATRQIEIGEHSDETREMVEDLVRSLGAVQVVVDRMVSRGTATRYMLLPADAQVIAECNDGIKYACERFHVRGMLRVLIFMEEFRTYIRSHNHCNFHPHFSPESDVRDIHRHTM